MRLRREIVNDGSDGAQAAQRDGRSSISETIKVRLDDTQNNLV